MSLFYRQAMRFVAYMKELSAPGFRQFLLALQRQEDFSGAFVSAFGLGIGDLARQYFETLRCTDCTALPVQASQHDTGQAAAAR